MNSTASVKKERARMVTWTPWRALEPEFPMGGLSLAETLDGGQAFRWHGDGDGVWTGQWADVAVRLRLNDHGRLEWSAPVELGKKVPEALRRYFALDRDFVELADRLPWRSDPHLARAIETFPGLPILRQPLPETLLAFLCSATKQIVQIKQMLGLLAERFGREVLPGFRALPDWNRLDSVSETDLRACALGFRARYIKAVARILGGRPGWEETLTALPYPEARDWLMQLPGVGEKVADCVLLFGAGRLEAFPVDVWILKVMRQRYHLEDWTLHQIAQFGRIHFGSAAGLAQQYLFAYERRVAAAAKPPN